MATVISFALNPNCFNASIASSRFLSPVFVSAEKVNLPRKSKIIWLAAFGPMLGSFFKNKISERSIAQTNCSGVVPPKAEIAVFGPTPFTEINLLKICFS